MAYSERKVGFIHLLMLETAFLRSRSLLQTLPVVAFLVCCGSPSFAQTQAQPQTTPPQSRAPVTNFDPTRREVQPKLDVDRDPVLSLDPEDNQPTGTGITLGEKRPGSEVYRLREDVDEVLLNVAVVDDKGHLVTD